MTVTTMSLSSLLHLAIADISDGISFCAPGLLNADCACLQLLAGNGMAVLDAEKSRLEEEEARRGGTPDPELDAKLQVRPTAHLPSCV
eukprot:COSAG04_NODE_1031_length_8627_cov_10.660765_8_plen_88_part_00